MDTGYSIQIVIMCYVHHLLHSHSDLFRGWGAQGFPTPEIFISVHTENSTKVLNKSDPPPPKNQKLMILY